MRWLRDKFLCYKPVENILLIEYSPPDSMWSSGMPEIEFQKYFTDEITSISSAVRQVAKACCVSIKACTTAQLIQFLSNWSRYGHILSSLFTSIILLWLWNFYCRLIYFLNNGICLLQNQVYLVRNS